MAELATTVEEQAFPGQGPAAKGKMRRPGAEIWAAFGISIAEPRPPAKSFTDRFINPLVKVDIVTGEVLAFRLPLGTDDRAAGS